MRGLSALSPLPADLSAVALAKAEASAKAGQHSVLSVIPFHPMPGLMDCGIPGPD